jgi:hypothetical protein
MKKIAFYILWWCLIVNSAGCEIAKSVNSSPVNGEELKTVSYGQVEFNNGKLELGIWTRGERPFNDRANGLKFPEYKANTSISYDIINCAGYLASMNGKSEYLPDEKKYGLKFEIIPETIAVDVAEKIKKCGPTEHFSQAFAVTPPDEKRRKTKSAETSAEDLEKTYKSLPSEITGWAESGIFGKESRQTKTLKPLLDDWADTDGNGKIDLLKLNGNCGEKADSEYTCGRILRLINGNWLEIAYITPL